MAKFIKRSAAVLAIPALKAIHLSIDWGPKIGKVKSAFKTTRRQLLTALASFMVRKKSPRVSRNDTGPAINNVGEPANTERRTQQKQDCGKVTETDL